jgi:endonuclease G
MSSVGDRTACPAGAGGDRLISMTANQRRSIILWFLFFLILVCIGTLVFNGVLSFRPHPTLQTEKTPEPVSSPQEQVASWSGVYYYAGMPRTTASFSDQLTVLTNIGYVVGYSEARKNPSWVCYRLSQVGSLKAPPRPQQFSVDARTGSRVSPADYTGSGYDRGHMAPNYAIAVCYGSVAQLETFRMSNIIPQKPDLNRRVWERLEQEEVKTYAQRFKTVWVIDGPIFDATPSRLRSGVAVPRACYKIIIQEEGGQPRMLALVMPQDATGSEKLGLFLTSVRNIEDETGLDFLNELPREMQDRVETVQAPQMW